MRLGLFNWTSDLSDEPEYPPFFDNLKNAFSGLTGIRGNEKCIISIDGGGEFDSTDIGDIEYLQEGGQRFGWEEHGELKSGVYLVLNQSFMSSWETPYIASADLQYQPDAYWSRFKPAVKEKFEKDPAAWCLATTGFTIKQIRNNFIFSDVEERYVCVNPEWNAKAVEILTAQSPTLMRKFNKCIQRIIDHNLIS